MKVHDVEKTITARINQIKRRQGYVSWDQRKQVRRDTVAEFRTDLAAQRARGR